MTPLLVSVKEASDMLSLSLTTVRALAADGVLKKKYIGKGTTSWRITYESLEAYIATLSQDPREVSA